MSYRVRRKFTSSKFYVEGQICKIFMEPHYEIRPGFWLWNVGFAIGKSNRQINDWYNKRKNKRCRSMYKKMTGQRAGFKAVKKGFEKVLRMRWLIQPGDILLLDCTSGDPGKQFKAWSRWHRYHPEWTFSVEKLEWYWHRPPYIDDPVRKDFNIRAITPEDPLANTDGSRYFDCFRVEPKVKGKDLSMDQISNLLSPILTS